MCGAPDSPSPHGLASTRCQIDRFSACLPITLAHEGGLRGSSARSWRRDQSRRQHRHALGLARPYGDEGRGVRADRREGHADLPKELLGRGAVQGLSARRGSLRLRCGGELRARPRGRLGEAGQGRSDAKAFVTQFCDIRLGFLKRLGTWSTFGKGWSRRVADIRAKATTMALVAVGVVAAFAGAIPVMAIGGIVWWADARSANSRAAEAITRIEKRIDAVEAEAREAR